MSPIVSGVLTALRVGIVIALVGWMLSQVRKPTGPFGKAVVRRMNDSHSTLTDWGLEHAPIERTATVLDIGCGGGRTLQKLAARAPDGIIHGIDISKASVTTSRETNAAAVARGQMKVELGSAQALPYPDCTFDLITAVETHYYWPDLGAAMREVFRTLKPGGTFVLIAEVYRGSRMGLVNGIAMKLIGAAYLSDAEHRALLTQAGLSDVTTFHKSPTDWICATGRRPS